MYSFKEFVPNRVVQENFYYFEMCFIVQILQENNVVQILGLEKNFRQTNSSDISHWNIRG